MRVLVTGGAGYVGSVAVPLLLARGHDVRVLDTLRSGATGLRAAIGHERFELVAGDVRDSSTVASVIQDTDAIIHLAAIVGYPACLRYPELAIGTNVDGTRTLLTLRKPEQRLIFASTGSVYGAVSDVVCTEETPTRPVTLYGETKATAEMLVRDAGNCVSFRFATAFGVSPAMRSDLLLNDFTFQAVRRGALEVYEAGFRRTFIHVRDIARALNFALDDWDALKGGVFNVGDEELNLTKAEVAARIRLQVDCELTLTSNGSDPDHRDYAVSYARLRAAGFSTSIGLDEGIEELVRAARLPMHSNGGADLPSPAGG